MDVLSLFCFKISASKPSHDKFLKNHLIYKILKNNTSHTLRTLHFAKALSELTQIWKNKHRRNQHSKEPFLGFLSICPKLETQILWMISKDFWVNRFLKKMKNLSKNCMNVISPGTYWNHFIWVGPESFKSRRFVFSNRLNEILAIECLFIITRNNCEGF